MVVGLHDADLPLRAPARREASGHRWIAVANVRLGSLPGRIGFRQRGAGRRAVVAIQRRGPGLETGRTRPARVRYQLIRQRQNDFRPGD